MRCLYSKRGIDYQQAYSGHYANLSFRKDEARMILASKGGDLSGFGRPAITFGNTEKLLPAFKKLAKDKAVWYMDYLESGADCISKYLLGRGDKGVPFYTQLIDLTRSEENLHADMRKSYRNLKNQRSAFVHISRDSVYGLRDLHIQVCGRETRPIETWNIQADMVESGEAFVVANGDWTSAGLFIYDETMCYYGVGKSLEGAASQPVLWRAILHAKEIGCREFEMGQTYDGTGYGEFKRGFGGTTNIRLEFGRPV